MRVVADTGPLVAATNEHDEAHELAAALVTELGRDLVVLDTVVVEVDHLLRAWLGAHSARAFLDSLIAGEHSIAFLTEGLLRRAAEFDAQYSDLDLGVADGSIMAFAERHRLPILTFDFAHFRATRPATGFWRLVVDETRYHDSTKL